jgi:hypothetical protein
LILKPTILIAMTGPAGAGKDTVADLLVTHCGFKKFAFADALRQEVSDAFGIEPLYLRRRETKEHAMSALRLAACLHDGFVGRIGLLHQQAGVPLDLAAPRSPRQIMQWWGTEYRRSIHPNYWTSQIGKKVAHGFTEGYATRAVITDCRFDNEAAMVRSFGGQIWQVRRQGHEVQGSHESDTTGDEFAPDAHLDNTGDILHLQALTLGAWLMHDASLTFHDLVRIGNAHIDHAGKEWHHKSQARLTLVKEQSA